MNRIQLKIIKDALEYPESLREWDVEFIDGLADKDDDYELSDKQNKQLNRICSQIA